MRCCRLLALLFAALPPGAAAGAAQDAIQPGAYEITAQTVMPHLEESLRYATTRERRCLRGRDLPSIFPVLRHRSLDGCALGNGRRRGGAIHFDLVCANPQAAGGEARLEAAPGRIAGTLEIKMGGKNMTFSQRIEATRLGECGPGP
jgi:hypothetical protein